MERTCAAVSIPWQALQGTTVLVTGATGLIGSALVKSLLWYSRTRNTDISVLALVRDPAKAARLFARPIAAGAPLSFVPGDVQTFETSGTPIHHVVHGAGVTASRAFVARPVETIRTTLRGTERVLELAREQQVRSVAFLSSMEVYAAPDGSRRITESTFDGLDPMHVRSSYPESKRMAEALCAAYAAEFAVPAKVLRLTQTLGPGVDPDDARVFAQFARSAVEGRDIVLHTPGDTERSYLYTADAVTAILTVLLTGENGQAYNVANEESYCSIRELAELVARTVGPAPVAVRLDLEDAASRGYAPTLRMDLDTAKLRALGWRPTVGLAEMFRRMTAVDLPVSDAT